MLPKSKKSNGNVFTHLIVKNSGTFLWLAEKHWTIGYRETKRCHSILVHCNEVHLNYVKCIIVYIHITLALYRLG